MSVTTAVRVVIIEDLREIRESLAILIAGTPGFDVAASYRTMEDALRGIKTTRPTVILTDIGLPGMDGIEGTRQLHELLPNVPILALTVYDDDEKVFNAICAGASGYLLKNTTPARLMESIGDVARRRRADVAGNRPTRRAAVSRVPAAADRVVPPDAAGDRGPEAPRRRAPLQDGRATNWASPRTPCRFTSSTSTRSSRSIRRPKPSPKHCAND